MPTTLRVSHDVLIEAPAERVWRTLTEEASSWWDTVSRGAGVVLEGFLGGRVEETGQRRPWGTVTDCCPGNYLVVAGPMGLPSGVHGMLELILSPDETGATLLHVEQRAYGPWEATRWAMATAGWAQMGERVREVAEGRA